MKVRAQLREFVRRSVGERQRMMLSRMSVAMGLRPRVNRAAAHSLPFPDGRRAAVLLSADLELAWAWRFARGVADAATLAHQRARQGRRNLSVVLDLCDRYQLPVTWAVVGHLILERCDRLNGTVHPELPRVPYFLNELWDYRSGDWFDHDPGLADPSHSEWADWHAPDLIRDILRRPVPHEIGCHTFSHMVFSDRFCPPLVAAAELQSSREAAGELGIRLQSFVFSGNLEGNHQALHDAGFRSYRADDWFDLDVPRRDSFDLWRINGGLCLDRPYADSPSSDHVRLLRRSIDVAIEYGLVCGLWFHPETDPRDVGEIFPPIFEYIASRRDDLWVTNMGEMADWLDRLSAPAAPRAANTPQCASAPTAVSDPAEASTEPAAGSGVSSQDRADQSVGHDT